jgi:putative ABC transport system permease protein
VTWLLEKVLGRLPIGWLQLAHRKGRLIAAIAGVAFANLLVFFQLGFLGALGTSVILPYEEMRADILISAKDSRTLTDGHNIPRLTMLDALAVEGVASATPVFVTSIPLKNVSETDLTLTAFGVDPADISRYWADDIAAGAPRLEVADTVLIDRETRFLSQSVIAKIESGRPIVFEIESRSLALAGMFSIGAGFEADGYAFMSDQTFLRLFPDQSARAPKHIMVKVEPGVMLEDVVRNLQSVMPDDEVKVRTVADAAIAARQFQTVERPVGIIFGFGAIMGVLVGLVIVYQVLSTEVGDHLREYATLKAIGYRGRYFVGIVAEQALILGLAGFMPGCLISSAIYNALAGTTGLPIEMTDNRALLVLVGTLAACIVSGLLAARKLASANPADLY